jgi:hypothetical protein
LSDRKNNEFPISRPDATLGSFIAIPDERKLFICYGAPTGGKYKEYKL